MFIGESKRIKALKRQLEQAASCALPILITGESGTGKELCAHYIYECGAYKGAFVPVNCTTLSTALADSELFGYAKNAFTGASQETKGLCEAADDGVLFLDEIGDLPMAVQGKLLRFLDNGQIRRVGDVRNFSVKTKIVSATNRDLPEMVNGGQFRADLYHRLAALRISTPPLSQHKEDIPALVAHFIKDTGCSCSHQAMAALCSRDYAGNVRELRNVVMEAAYAADGNEIEAKDIRAFHYGNVQSSSLRDMQCAMIRERLQEYRHNISKTANVLGIHRNTLRRLAAKLGISK